MASLNCVHLIGNLGQDPDLRYTNSGDPVCSISIATNNRWKDRDTGEQKEHTEWHRCTLWGKDAENAAQYLKKGSPVYFQGELRTRTYEKEGQTHYATEIRVFRMQFLSTGGGGPRPPHPADDSSVQSAGAQTQHPQGAPSADQGQTGEAPPFDDDIPF